MATSLTPHLLESPSKEPFRRSSIPFEDIVGTPIYRTGEVTSPNKQVLPQRIVTAQNNLQNFGSSHYGQNVSVRR